MLVEALLSEAPAALRERVRESGDATLAERLQRAFEDAARGWPDVAVPLPHFARYVSTRLPAEASAAAPWDGLHLSDLYLACGCASADHHALAAFERAFADELHRAAARMAGDDVRGDDFEQSLREKLFVSAEGPPKIVEYSGQGSLRRWLRITARRTYIDLSRKQGRVREQPIDEDELAIVGSAADNPELAFLQGSYREALRAALVESMSELSRRQRGALRYHFVHRLSIAEVAGIFRVHRATAGRWIAEARQLVLARTRDVLVLRLGVSDGELHSVLRLVESRFDITMSALLRPIK